MMILQNSRGREAGQEIRERVFPVRGWNARDPASAMRPEHAAVLRNVVVAEQGLSPRPGYSMHFHGMAEPVEALLSWYGDGVPGQLFAATASLIYDVTRKGGRTRPSLTGLHSGAWSSAMMANEGGQFLVAVNGADAVHRYDGKAWETGGLTGVDEALLVGIVRHKFRLWFIERQSRTVWFLPERAIKGPLSPFPLDYLLRQSSHVVAGASLSSDGGKNADDRIVFVSSAGEMIVYSGTNPAREETWQLVGVYRVPRPVGPKCFVEVGPDLGYLSVDGLMLVPALLKAADSEKPQTALSDVISNEWRTPETARGAQAWEAIEDPARGLLIVNAPLSEVLPARAGIDASGSASLWWWLPTIAGSSPADIPLTWAGWEWGDPWVTRGLPDVPGRAAGRYVTARQLVYCQATRAWAEWTGHRARCWARMGRHLYYGTIEGDVRRLSGTTDAGAAIEARISDAYDRYGTAASKEFRRIKLMLDAQSTSHAHASIEIDYRDPATYVANNTLQSQSLWGQVNWGSPWSAPARQPWIWRGVTGRGHAARAAIVIKSTADYLYRGYQVAFTRGGNP